MKNTKNHNSQMCQFHDNGVVFFVNAPSRPHAVPPSRNSFCNVRALTVKRAHEAITETSKSAFFLWPLREASGLVY
jgi:hypothetical protein